MSKLTIRKGKTFTHVLRYGAEPFCYKAITAITRTALESLQSWVKEQEQADG